MSGNLLLPTHEMYRLSRRKNRLSLISDLMLIAGVYLGAAQLSGRSLLEVDILILTGISIGWYFSSKLTNLYNEFRTVTFIDELLVLLPNLLSQFLLLALSLFFLKDENCTRAFTLIYTLILTGVVAGKMYLVRKWQLYRNVKGLNQSNIVIVGEKKQVEGFIEMISSNLQFGYRILGSWGYRASEGRQLPLADTIDFLNGVSYETGIDELIIVPRQFDEGYLKGLITWADRKGILVRFAPGFFQFRASRYSFELFGNYPLITVRSTPLEAGAWRMVKRAFDVIFSLLFLIGVASWLFPLIALAIRLDSKGSVFFIQERWGEKARTIRVWKFRTMQYNAPTVREDGLFHQTVKNDPRVTKVGAFLRKTNLDELPQFLNVLCGTMSVVGPRPHAVKHSLEILPKVENYMIRHRLKPGITGWAQVNGFRGETQEIGLMRKRVDYDIWYIENWSLVLDFEIVLRTIYAMLKGDSKAF